MVTIMSRASNIKRGERMDDIDKIVVQILSEESDYRVQGGKAFHAILTQAFIDTLPETVIPYITSHDWNIIYTGTDFTSFVGKFFKALDGFYSRINVADTWREGARIVKKATFVKDEEHGDADGEKKHVRVEPFLTISDGNSKAKWGVLSDTCDKQDMFVVNKIKYIGLCEQMVRYARMLSQDNRFFKDKGERATTRLRVLLKAINENGLVIDKVKPEVFQTSLDKLRTYEHLKGIGIKPSGEKDEIFDVATVAPKKRKVAKSALSATKMIASKSSHNRASSLVKALSTSVKSIGTSKLSPVSAPARPMSARSGLTPSRKSGVSTAIKSMTMSVKQSQSPRSHM